MNGKRSEHERRPFGGVEMRDFLEERDLEQKGPLFFLINCFPEASTPSLETAWIRNPTFRGPRYTARVPAEVVRWAKQDWRTGITPGRTGS